MSKISHISSSSLLLLLTSPDVPYAALPYVKWILPNAPERPISLAYGQKMPAWFDLSSLEKLTDAASEDIPGLNTSAAAIQALVLQHSVDLPAHRTVVGGFSQGSAMALLAGLTGPENDAAKGREIEQAVGGVVALSGWLPMRTTVEARFHKGATKLPVFWGHGKADQVVNWQCEWYMSRSACSIGKATG